MGEIAEQIKKWCEEHKPKFNTKCPDCGRMFTHFGIDGDCCPECYELNKENQRKKTIEKNREAKWGTGHACKGD